jgi:hypothetical protein
MNLRHRKTQRARNRGNSTRRRSERQFDVDIIALHGSGTSFATSEIGKRLTDWLANFPPDSRAEAGGLLGQTFMTTNFDALLAAHHGVCPFESKSFEPLLPAFRPPAGAQYLLLLLPKKYREGLLGDLEEEYRTVVLPRHGQIMAQFYYWAQVVGLFVPLALRFVEKLLGRR